MKKIKISICCGTSCYVLGNFEILDWKNKLSSEYEEILQITGSPCLGKCMKREFGNPPFVMINGVLMAEASIDKIVTKIETIMAGDDDGK